MVASRPGLLRATLTLLAGGAAAQALPLLLGPLLTRLYKPDEFGVYHLFAAVAANLAVVACARYEFALPVAKDDAEADGLRALCLRLLAIATGLATVAALIWSALVGAGWPLWLPLAVAALGLASLATLSALRAQRFHALALARFIQHGGGALLQSAAGWGHWGVTGLIAAPILAAVAAAAVLRLRLAGVWSTARERLVEIARRHRQFPLLNTPHAFAGALLDTVALAIIAAQLGPAAAGFWGLAQRYLKAPATLIGGAVSQAIYPRLAQSGPGPSAESRAVVGRVMLWLAAVAAPMVVLLWAFSPWAFEHAFGSGWRDAGELARALALYIGFHFVASPLGVVTMAWNAQAWALKLALVGQAAFVAALVGGLQAGGLSGAGWAVSLAMAAYFGWYFWKLATWPLAAEPAGSAT